MVPMVFVKVQLRRKRKKCPFTEEERLKRELKKNRKGNDKNRGSCRTKTATRRMG